MRQHWIRALISVFVLAPIAAMILFGPQRSLADATAIASPAPTSSAAVSPAPTADNAVAARAREWFGRLQRGDIDRAQLTKDLNAALTSDKLLQISAWLKPLGEPTSFTLIDKAQHGEFTTYRYHLDVKGGAITFNFVLDHGSMIAGVFVTPV
jgi:hypothetical protein